MCLMHVPSLPRTSKRHSYSFKVKQWISFLHEKKENQEKNLKSIDETFFPLQNKNKQRLSIMRIYGIHRAGPTKQLLVMKTRQCSWPNRYSIGVFTAWTDDPEIHVVEAIC
ncbi:hypothetical protein I7I50_07766 [Histoplasma capsulatum G186AR]|uniref:Uncharacterized protein n=1 Tax=Ajellomyces capsulatus TaxID=5037 RepID=A0A8H7YW49_AJECA|nr:hypothetical protein I7I52_09161 [Histoplasma capsulatum]QSS68378.1 hypothetical protein I7I50_07766 [Histoplasma capsulatum G186AR]